MSEARSSPWLQTVEMSSESMRRAVRTGGLVILAAGWLVTGAKAEDDATSTRAASAAQPPQQEVMGPILITCASKPGERQHCPANTSKGVALARSSGESACLLGKTWGFDDQGIWVSDGCTGDFLVARPEAGTPEAQPEKRKPLSHIPNIGFLLVSGEKGEIYVRLFSYARYLNQKALDASYTDYFGKTHTVPLRQDIQLNKFFLPFTGWFLTPKFRYYLYVWSSNPSQGDPAQVVGAGNLSYSFNRFVTLGAGITSLPSVRSTEGQFPYWLGVDDRLTSDEFFRGSYTTGLWLKGEVYTKLKYMAMIANNLSTLGVSASQLDNKLETVSFMLQWLPTTGEFGLYGTFGDFDFHEKTATRLGAHYTHSREDKQSQPGTNGIENSQIRLTDGSVIFTPDLFGPGITVNQVTYDMVSIDGGIKKKGFSLEAEYYWRFLSDFTGTNTSGIADIHDHGFQVQSSAMIVPKVLQGYVSGAAIRGRYGNSSEIRAGANWYIVKDRGLRVNAEWIHLNKCPVGYTAVPYPVGGNGNVFHTNLEMNF
jgi:hypothetical protein